MKYVKGRINNKKLDIKICSGFFSKSKGLMFSRKLKNNEALLFEFDREGNWLIHMFFVFFPIDVVWLDRNMKVVDVKIGRPFDFLLVPRKKSKYVLELNANSGIKVSDKLKIYK